MNIPKPKIVKELIDFTDPKTDTQNLNLAKKNNDLNTVHKDYNTITYLIALDDKDRQKECMALQPIKHCRKAY